MWKPGINFGRDCRSVTRIIVRQPGFNSRTKPLYFSARSSCNFNSGTYGTVFVVPVEIISLSAYKPKNKLNEKKCESFENILTMQLIRSLCAFYIFKWSTRFEIDK